MKKVSGAFDFDQRDGVRVGVFARGVERNHFVFGAVNDGGRDAGRLEGIHRNRRPDHDQAFGVQFLRDAVHKGRNHNTNQQLAFKASLSSLPNVANVADLQKIFVDWEHQIFTIKEY